MQLLKAAEVETGPQDRVFSHSRARAIVAVAIVLAIAAVLVVRAVTRHWTPGYYFAGGILLFLELLRRFVTARFRPSNWLVRINDAGLFIQFRSYLNFHLPPEDMTVVFLAYPEIRSARLVKERTKTQDASNQNRTQTQTIRYIELELAGDPAPLEKALSDERGEQAPTAKRWYGSSSTLYQDFPVRMEPAPFLRIKWDVVPGPKRLLEGLRPYTAIGDPVFLTQDFVHLQGLSQEEQQRRLRELAQRGNTIAAVYTARKLYKCSLGEAKEMVDRIMLEGTEEPKNTPAKTTPL